MKEKKEVKPADKKKFLTLFIILIPSLLLAMTSAIDSQYVRLFFQVVLIISQTVTLKSLLDDYYESR
jgi:hypothetical protein